MKRLLYLIIFVALGIWFSSCRTQYVPIETVKIDYKVRDSIRFDSIYQRDSVFLYKDGDTVYQYKYKYLYRYLTINKLDTLIERDSIQVPYPIEKRLTKWQTIKMQLGGWAFGGFILLLGVTGGWLVYKWRKNEKISI